MAVKGSAILVGSQRPGLWVRSSRRCLRHWVESIPANAETMKIKTTLMTVVVRALPVPKALQRKLPSTRGAFVEPGSPTITNWQVAFERGRLSQMAFGRLANGAAET